MDVVNRWMAGIENEGEGIENQEEGVEASSREGEEEDGSRGLLKERSETPSPFWFQMMHFQVKQVD